MNKEIIKQKISEALSASLGDWNREFEHDIMEIMRAADRGDDRLYARIAAELILKNIKIESEIKSALETIDWD